MKLTHLFFAALTLFVAVSITSCNKEETITIDSSLPQGAFTVSKAGSIVAQNETGSKGTVQVGADASGASFVKLGSDFSTVLATGTVTVYLSTSDVFKASPGTGNPDLKIIGFATKNGEMYYKLSTAPEAKFNHLILWCGTAGLPFGYAKLQ